MVLVTLCLNPLAPREVAGYVFENWVDHMEQLCRDRHSKNAVKAFLSEKCLTWRLDAEHSYATPLIAAN